MSFERTLQSLGGAIEHEDDSIIVIDKPAGLLVLPDRYDDDKENLQRLLEDAYERIWTVHRIDKETSGLIVFAKDEQSHSSLNGQFSARTVEKTYIALCKGAPNTESGRIEFPLREREGRGAAVVVDINNGKDAVTDFEVSERFAGFSVLRVTPHTGRQHQIRVHLMSIGTPILCDRMYGGGVDFRLSEIKPKYKGVEEEKPLLARVGLHASGIAFDHPVTGERLRFSSELHKDMATVIKQLKKLRPVR